MTFDWILSDWETNYEPRDIPAVIVQTGDLYQFMARFDSTTKALEEAALPAIAALSGSGRACERLPLLYMWDDFDFAGNNSSRNRQIAFAAERDPYGAAMTVWNWLWRDHPRPAPPSVGYSVEIAGVPFIVTDNRSQREQAEVHPGVEGIVGDEDWSAAPSAFGKQQREWLISKLSSLTDRGLVILVCGSTFRDQIAAHDGGTRYSTRDSVGIWFKGERNYVLQKGCIDSGACANGNLVVWSGDDHRNSVFAGVAGEALPATQHEHPGEPLPLKFYELKVISGPSSVIGLSGIVFGWGEMFEWTGINHDCVLRWDISSTSGGIEVEARATYFHVSGSQKLPGAGGIPTANRGAAIGRAGDFCYSNGALHGCGTSDAAGREQEAKRP
jgi:hypothetical protein